MQLFARITRKLAVSGYECSSFPKTCVPVAISSQWIDSAFKEFITLVDRALRVRLHIFEFTQDKECILRASLTRAKYSITLISGDQICRGDLVLELHFWNERLASILKGQSILCRGIHLRRSLHQSLVQLAKSLEQQGDMQSVKAVHARLARSARKPLPVHAPFGFEFVSMHSSRVSRIHNALESVLIHALCWTFRPADQRRRFSAVKRIEMWMPRKEFLDLYRCAESTGHKTRKFSGPISITVNNLAYLDTTRSSRNEPAPQVTIQDSWR